MLPKGFLVGNLAGDPQSGIAAANQNSYSRFSVACNDIYSKPNSSPKAHFFNCVVWGKRSQFVQNFLKKGDKVFIEYTLSTSSFNTKDGRVVRSVDLVVDNIESLGNRSASNESNNQENISYSRRSDFQDTHLDSSNNDDDDISLDDIYSDEN